MAPSSPALVPDHLKTDHDWAALTAQQVYENWHNPVFRNALEFALGEFIEDMLHYHRAELHHMCRTAGLITAANAKKSVMKAYLHAQVAEIAKQSLGLVEKDFNENEPRDSHGRWTDRLRGGPHSETVTNQARAAARATELVNNYARAVESGAIQGIHVIVRDKNTHKVKDEFVSEDGNLSQRPLRKGEVYEIRPMGISKPATLGGQAFNISQALGQSPDVSIRVGQKAKGADHLKSMMRETSWGPRVLHAANALQAFGGTNPQVATAAALAKAVGQEGPEAAKVLGPYMRLYNYKYRGRVATPEQTKKVLGDTPLQPYSTPAGPGRIKTDTVPGFEQKLAADLAKTIPTDPQIDLLLRTGSTPPSTGVMLDAKGKVQQLAVGHADDHYVPFNLRQLDKLKGGSYVRTRAYGGPTTEDFAVALHGGANRFNVISKNGYYTVQLAPNQGRFGPNQRLLLERYGKLLDAVKSGKLRYSGELVRPESGERSEVQQTLILNGKGYEVALHALQQQFPFMIDSVQYIPASNPAMAPVFEGIRASEHETDKGYVRPYFLKPETAQHGYYDPLLGGNATEGWEKPNYDAVDGYRYGLAKRHGAFKAVAAKPTAEAEEEREGGAAAAAEDREAGRAGFVRPAEAEAEWAGATKPQQEWATGKISPDAAAHFVTSVLNPLLETAEEREPEWLEEGGDFGELKDLHDNFASNEAPEENQVEFIRAMSEGEPLRYEGEEGLPNRYFSADNIRVALYNEAKALAARLTEAGHTSPVVRPDGTLIEAGMPFPEFQAGDETRLGWEEGERQIHGIPVSELPSARKSRAEWERDPDYHKFDAWRGAANLGEEKRKKLAAYERDMEAQAEGDIQAREERQRPRFVAPGEYAGIPTPALIAPSEVEEQRLAREAAERAGPVVPSSFHPQAAGRLTEDPAFERALRRMRSPQHQERLESAAYLDGLVDSLSRDYGITREQAQNTITQAAQRVQRRNHGRA